MPTPRRVVLLLPALWPLLRASAAAAAPDVWSPIRPFVGSWTGTSSGQAGSATVSRSYAWALGQRYLHEVNASVYAPQEKNKLGERHEHWGLFSYDMGRKLIVLRQFHVEGFVNTYRIASAHDNQLVFESEAFENFSNAWRARESYEFASADEFTEIFELAGPGRAFEVYSRTRLTRVR